MVGYMHQVVTRKVNRNFYSPYDLMHTRPMCGYYFLANRCPIYRVYCCSACANR